MFTSTRNEIPPLSWTVLKQQLSQAFSSSSGASREESATLTALFQQRLESLQLLQEVLDVFIGGFEGSDDLLRLLRDCESVLLTNGELRFDELLDAQRLRTSHSPLRTSHGRRFLASPIRSTGRSDHQELYQALTAGLNEFLHTRGPMSGLQQFTPFCTVPLHQLQLGTSSSGASDSRSPGGGDLRRSGSQQLPAVTRLNQEHGTVGVANELRMRSILGYTEIRRLAAEYEGYGRNLLQVVWDNVSRRLGARRTSPRRGQSMDEFELSPSLDLDEDDDERFFQESGIQRRRRSDSASSAAAELPPLLVEEEELYHRLEYALVHIFGVSHEFCPVPLPSPLGCLITTAALPSRLALLPLMWYAVPVPGIPGRPRSLPIRNRTRLVQLHARRRGFLAGATEDCRHSHAHVERCEPDHPRRAYLR